MMNQLIKRLQQINRDNKYSLFIKYMNITSQDKILDLGGGLNSPLLERIPFFPFAAISIIAIKT